MNWKDVIVKNIYNQHTKSLVSQFDLYCAQNERTAQTEAGSVYGEAKENNSKMHWTHCAIKACYWD